MDRLTVVSDGRRWNNAVSTAALAPRACNLPRFYITKRQRIAAGGINPVNFQLRLHFDDVDAESTPSVVAQGTHACAPFVNGQSYGEYHVRPRQPVGLQREQP
jgi:hypothetical protein